MTDTAKAEDFRTARCSCGGLQVTASGPPRFVLACHCVECQRRTGSVFGVGAYYPEKLITARGPDKTYVRDGQNGRKPRIHFCPDCGTSVYLELELLPGHFGVAVGAFADPKFPAPVLSAWEQSHHSWLDFSHKPPGSAQQPAR